MQVSRTMIAAVISLISGVLTMLGVTLPEDAIATLQQNIELAVGALLAIYGVVMMIFRALTETPLVKFFWKGPL